MLRAAIAEDYSLATQGLVDALTIWAHRGAGLGGFLHRKGLAAQRNYIGAGDSRADNLVFLHIVEELWRVIPCRLVDTGIRPLYRLGGLQWSAHGDQLCLITREVPTVAGDLRRLHRSCPIPSWARRCRWPAGGFAFCAVRQLPTGAAL